MLFYTCENEFICKKKSLSYFRLGRGECLVSSDLCNIRIDNTAINFKVNFDFSKNSETCLQRINRSGRFGKYNYFRSFRLSD